MSATPPCPHHLAALLLACAAAAAHGQDDPLPPAPAPALQRNAALTPLPGVDIHYDLLSAPDTGTAPGRLAGQVALPRGSMQASVLVNPAAPAGRRVERLDTRWQGQMPNALQALVLGDTYGSGGGWSRPVRYGGLRFGRGLTLRPGYEVAPQSPVAGAAALPPTSLGLAARSLALPDFGDAAGAISPVATLPGLQGGAALPGPAIGAPGALDAGASDYEVEAGRLRTGWGTAEDRYGEGYAAAAYRRGLGADITAEARAEWTRQRAAGGLELSSKLPVGMLRAVFAQSATPAQAGLRWGMGLQAKVENTDLNLSWDEFERGYAQLAAAPGEATPRGRVRAGASLPLWGRANAGVSYVRESLFDASATGALQLSAGVPLAARSKLSMNYTHKPGDPAGWRAGLTLAVPLERQAGAD